MALALSGACLAAQVYTYIEAKNGKEIGLDKLAAQLQKYDIVFFGEWHDNVALHQAEADLAAALFTKDPRLLLSFEMFERDVQNWLDAYLKGDIGEEEFLANSRPWGNYATDYRPLVEFARQKGLSCVAANVPRRLAGKAARAGAGFEEELPPEDRVLMALKVNAPNGQYRDNFLATMQANAMHGDAQDTELYDRLYFAQCLKDDTMAESVLQYRERYPKRLILHFNGDFHSAGFLGTVERVRWRNRKVKIAVISPLETNSPWPENAHKTATYFIRVPVAPEAETGATGGQP